jgi:hypothetical protein
VGDLVCRVLDAYCVVRRRYTRVAVGKSRAMDVVTGESSGSSGQLLLLYPLLFREWQLCGCVAIIA